MNRQSHKSNPSFGRAMYEESVRGPSGKVVDAETGQVVPPQIEHTTLEYQGTKVDIPKEMQHRVLSASGVELGSVVDYQQPISSIQK